MEQEKIEKLIRSVQKRRDTDAFSKIYDQFVTQIYRYVFFKVPKDDVEDIVETVFLKAWENIDQYSSQVSKSFSSWLFRIAHNLVVDHYRFAQNHPEDSLHEFVEIIQDERVEHNPLKRAKRELDKDIVRKALDRLSDNHRQIIVLKFLNELENPEIARILDKSEGSLRILQHRALKSLKDVLVEMGFPA